MIKINHLHVLAVDKHANNSPNITNIYVWLSVHFSLDIFF